MGKKIDCGPFVPERIAEWAYWIVQREAIRVKREEDPEAGPPWHDDPVMANTRWCNVRRMDDKVSVWLMENWYPRYQDQYIDPATAVIAALLGRMVNKPETLSALTGGNRFQSIGQFDYQDFRDRMEAIKAEGKSVFTGAYIINSAAGGSKIDVVLRAIDDARKRMRKAPMRYLRPASMRETAEALQAIEGMGSFMSGQVVADLRWVMRGKELRAEGYTWDDRMQWAPPGPGSSKGMKYLLGMLSANEMDGRGKDMTEKEFLKYLPMLIDLAQRYPGVCDVFEDRRLEAHDIQNTLCETSKYIRVKNGGHAKNNYPPSSRSGIRPVTK